MLSKNPTEELVYHLTRVQRNSFHYGELPSGVQKLLELIKENGFVVHLTERNGQPEPKLISKDDCTKFGLAYEHQICSQKHFQ